MPVSPAVARLARIRVSLATQFDNGLRVGSEWSFMLVDGYDVFAWVPRAGYLTLQVAALDESSVWEMGPVLRTVTVCPGEYRELEIIAEGVVLGETHGAHAAMTIAVDYLLAPSNAERQDDHDAFAV